MPLWAFIGDEWKLRNVWPETEYTADTMAASYTSLWDCDLVNAGRTSSTKARVDNLGSYVQAAQTREKKVDQLITELVRLSA
jgi:hypothetical protein